jgi:peptidoglycan/LPS O-acetylase OafA/YrhL
MIRSITVNVLLLVFGSSLVLFALVIAGGHLLATKPASFPIGPFAFFATLGAWCTAGAINNLRRRRTPPPDPELRTSVLVEWNIALIVSSLLGTVLFGIYGDGNVDRGPLQRAVGMVMVLAVLAAPFVLGAHVAERLMKARRRLP